MMRWICIMPGWWRTADNRWSAIRLDRKSWMWLHEYEVKGGARGSTRTFGDIKCLHESWAKSLFDQLQLNLFTRKEVV